MGITRACAWAVITDISMWTVALYRLLTVRLLSLRWHFILCLTKLGSYPISDNAPYATAVGLDHDMSGREH